jgi:tRNA(fMet)-specific endonuclease VapC
MRCLDSTFLVDLAKDEPAARAKAKAWFDAGEMLSVAAPALAEILQGAFFRGGAHLTKTYEMLSTLEVLDVDRDVAAEAGRLGAELLKEGAGVSTTDLLIAACARFHGQVLVTRDTAFSRIPGLGTETY